MQVEKTTRISSIDLLRGIIMVIMALDHVRHIWHADAHLHDPEDISTTTPILFFTRWITHYCAPVFIFLAGTSAFLYSQKPNSHPSRFLFTRGIWLIFLEITIFSFGWQLQFSNTILLLVIWAIGISMVFLSVMIKLPYYAVLATGLILVFFHDLTDGFTPEKGTAFEVIWTLLHKPGNITINEHLNFFVLYSVLPYFGLICLGYCLGKLFLPETEPAKRKKFLVTTGFSCLCLFVVLRAFNLYGDPEPFIARPDLTHSILAFLRVSKYPISLLFTLMTIGPALIFLGLSGNVKGKVPDFFIVFGKVPMFYYILHIYLIHVTARLLGANNSVSLSMVYLIWVIVILVLYFPCKWYAKYKYSHPEKRWLSYL
jgi:uncharacterized membrane protein